MATKVQNARQPYGLTDELVDSLLQGSTQHEEMFGEDGIYRQLTKRLFELCSPNLYCSSLAQHDGAGCYQRSQGDSCT